MGVGVGAAPIDDNGKPVLALWNDATGQPIPVHVGATVTGADGKTYALLDVNATVQAAANQRVNTHAGDIAAGSAVAGAFADGADATQGAKGDAAATDSTSSWSVVALLKGIIAKLLASIAVTQSGTWTMQPGNTPNTSAWLMQDVVASANGPVPYHNITAASTNFTNVKGSACQCYGLDLSNTSSSAIYVKLYDKATAPGTGDVPKRTIQVPANGTVIRTFPKGLKFVSGFGWAATGAVGDSDNTNIAANCVVDFDLNS